MVHSDPVADMLSRIRNAILVNKTSVSMPHSKFKEMVAKELVACKFIDSVDVEGEGVAKTMTISIHAAGTNPRISVIEKVSKPGRRMYAKVEDIPKVKNGRGVVIVSTSKGIMTGENAKKQQIGGELICKVY